MANPQAKRIIGTAWITGLISRVHLSTGLSPDRILAMPLNTALYYYLDYAKNQGAEIIRITPEEILRQADERTAFLILDFLKKNGKISPEEQQHLYLIMTEKNKQS